MWTVHLLKMQFTLLYLYLDTKPLTLNQGSGFVNCSKFNILFHNMKMNFHLVINKVIPVVSYCIF